MSHDLTILGRLGSEPEYNEKYGVANVSVASTKTWKGDDGEKKESTVWFRAAIWGARGAAFARFHNKGDGVYFRNCELKPDIRVWTGDDGEPRASYEITVGSWEFVPGKGGGSATEADDEPLFNEKPASNGAKPPWEK